MEIKNYILGGNTMSTPSNIDHDSIPMLDIHFNMDTKQGIAAAVIAMSAMALKKLLTLRK